MGRLAEQWNITAANECGWKLQEMYFGKHLTRICSHTFALSLFFCLFSSFSPPHSLSLLCASTHRQSHLTESFKTMIMASYRCSGWAHMEFACWVWHCQIMKAFQHRRSIEVMLVDNIINQLERLSWVSPVLISLTAIISYWCNCHSAVFIAVITGFATDY